MKNLSLLAVTILFMLFQVNAVLYAQQNARTVFAEGKQAFEQEEYVEAYNKFTEVREILGEPKMRLQPWLVKSTYAVRRNYKAREYLQEYFNLNPDPNLLEYEEMEDYNNYIRSAISKSQDEYEKVKNKNTLRGYRSYLQEFADGPYIDKVKAHIDELDQKAFESINENNLYSIDEYLNNFPNGNFRDEAIIYREAYYFQKAKRKGTKSALEKFKSRYPNSKYYENAERAIAKIEEAERKRRLAEYNRLTNIANDYKKKYRKKKTAMWLWIAPAAFSLYTMLDYGSSDNSNSSDPYDLGTEFYLGAAGTLIFSTIAGIKGGDAKNYKSIWKKYESRASKYISLAPNINPLNDSLGFQLVIKF